MSSHTSQNQEAEQAVIGGLLLDPEQFPMVQDAMSPLDLFGGVESRHGRFYVAMLKAYEARQPMDVLGAADWLMTHGATGDLTYFTSLPDRCPVTENLAHYARIVREHANRRRLLDLATRIRQVALDRSVSVDEVLGKTEGYVRTLQAATSADNGWQSSEASAADFLEDLDTRQRRHTSGERHGITTGISPLDTALGGPIEAGSLVVLAARPSVGKTALALQIGDHNATAGIGTGFVSVEMATPRLTRRRVASASKVPHGALKAGDVNLVQRQNVIAALDDMATRPFWVSDSKRTLEQIVGAVLRLKARHPGIGLFVVDYLQLIEAKGKDNTERAGKISRAMKLLAKDTESVVVLLSQLNRACTSRPDPRANMSDLRDSGAIEQDADIILFPFRSVVFDTNADPVLAEIRIDKNRDGEPRTISELYWDGPTQRFLTTRPLQDRRRMM